MKNDIASNSKDEKHSFEPILRQLIDKNRPELEEFSVGFNNILTKFGAFLQKLAIEFEKARPRIVEVLEAFRAMPHAYRVAMLKLGENGWYLDGNMALTQPMELAKKLVDGQIDEVELLLEDYFTNRQNEIELELIEAFPKRAKIISAAFSAHRSEQYELSIPVILTQVEGICAELTGLSPFIRRDKKPEIAAYIDSLGDIMMEALLAPLGENLPVSASAKDRPPNFTMLNRHMVLHGESFDYGTRRNSLRAISLLNYITQYLLMSKTPIRVNGQGQV